MAECALTGAAAGSSLLNPSVPAAQCHSDGATIACFGSARLIFSSISSCFRGVSRHGMARYSAKPIAFVAYSKMLDVKIDVPPLSQHDLGQTFPRFKQPASALRHLTR